ncbi:MAG TPA: 3-dehydroquinate synthase [Rhizobiales bacterium]|nr:3-dehydroquinate synthase [Hyphomicrobiales bacterium]
MTIQAAERPSQNNTVTITVGLENRSYDIVIGTGLIDRAADHIAPCLPRPRTAIITDENVARHHLDTLTASLEAAGIAVTSIVMPPGEATKSFSALESVCDQLLEADIERNDVIIAFGGGVIGDLAGFSASVLRRGIRFIQIPTSLLAQVDSSVGGKTGINSKLGKNLIGAFHQPVLVLADIGVLDTLPEREFRAGYAEVAKYGLIDNPEFFDWLDQNHNTLFGGEPGARRYTVETSCRAKSAIVEEDELEHGRRALLNLGHTFGHALEAATGYSQRLIHGEGVAIGMVMAFDLSVRLGLCPKHDLERMEAHLKSVGLPTRAADIAGSLPGPEEFLGLMSQDKKANAGVLTFILTRGIGKAFITSDVTKDVLLSFLKEHLPPQ